MRALVTGGGGFVGRRLMNALFARKDAVTVLARNQAGINSIWPAVPMKVHIGDLEQPSSLIGVCEGVATVFHLAGFAHAVDVDDEKSREQHERVTVGGTRALIEEAARAGVRCFVFASSVKAMGGGGNACLDESSDACPVSAYGQAKRAAEQLVLEAGRRYGWHVAVVRFPMVYGVGSQGNLPRMIAAVDRGLFPPLPRIGNRRSMVHVDDAVQALLLAAERPQALGQIYIVTDGLIYSTVDIYRQIRMALGKEKSVWYVPLSVLRLGARIGDLIGTLRGRPFSFDSAALSKLTGSAWYSNRKIHCELGFRPTRTLADALPAMVVEYRGRSNCQ